MLRPDTIDGLFHDGDPLIGTKGTTITAAFLNALMDNVEIKGTYANNAAALSAGLTAGQRYKTSTGVVMVVY